MPLSRICKYKLQQEILLIDAPPEFEPVLTDWKKTATIHKGEIQGKHISTCAMIFVKTTRDVSVCSKEICEIAGTRCSFLDGISK
jgi:hypothetical protein